MLPKSRKNTLAALNSSATAVPHTPTMAKPSSPAPSPTGSGVHPTATPATVRMTRPGTTWKAETIIDATGNISRGIDIFFTIALLRTIERVPAPKVSVK